MNEVERRGDGLRDEGAQVAYVIGLDALAALYHRLASERDLPLSWAVQGMLDAFAGQCQLDVQARERARARLSPWRAHRSGLGNDGINIGAMARAPVHGPPVDGAQVWCGNNATRGEEMKGELSRAERRWRCLVLAVLLPLAVIGALLLLAMSDDGVVRLLQAAVPAHCRPQGRQWAGTGPALTMMEGTGMAVTQENVGVSDDEVKVAVVPDKTAEALAAVMFTQRSARELYRLLSVQAAQLERQGRYDGAMRTWTQAAAQALYVVDRHWCESRAQWCELCLRRQD